jgi:hypothetical protein
MSSQETKDRGTTMATSKCGLAVGTTSTITAATATTYSIGGTAYTETLGSNQAHVTTDANTGVAFVAVAPGYGCALVYGFSSAATSMVCVQGAPQALTGSSDGSAAACKFITAPNFAAIPDNFCPIGYVILKVGSAASAFTPGTSSWNASNVGTAAVSVLTLPPKPQVS